MSPRITPPKIDERKANDLFRSLREMAPHYTPGWPAKDDDDPGVALLKVFSFIGEGVISRLNRAPDRNFLAFLDMLGIRLLQARPAYAPIRILVANGTEFPFLVAKGTQVSAPPTEQHPVDLPFETLSNLFVVPSAIASLIAVDPEQDTIYTPPPGFLELSLAAKKLPLLTVTAFSAAQSNTLQLDPADQLKKGDFLRIDQTVTQRTGADQCVPVVEVTEQQQSEHLVVSDVKGSVVTVTDPLSRDYAEGTQVQKVTQFELFVGKNWQEHILFIGHSDYFSIKSEAQFKLLVEHAPGVNSNLQPLNIVWEYFGNVDLLKDKGDGWFEFQVDADGTQGFSRDGQVLLTKPAGEIKETEINGTKSRWIRARLDQSLPATPPTPLPRIELITLAVSSGGRDLAPDNAFSNDTPLTTDVAFFPFGTEPRIFDRFSIASAEAFSKPGAEVTLDLELDFTDLLASPVAIYKGNQIRAFAHGAAGRLIEFQIDPLTSVSVPIQHKSPTDRRLVGEQVPSVVEDVTATMVGIFSQADDGHVHLRYLPNENAVSRQWIEIRTTGVTGELKFGPAAILASGVWKVYGVFDGRVFEIDIDPANPNLHIAWVEIPSGSAPRPVAACRPALIRVAPNIVWVVVVDQNGHTWVNDGTVWRDLWAEIPAPADAFLAKANTRPDVVSYTVALQPQARIYFRGANDQLIVLNTEPPGTVLPRNLSSPLNVGLDSAPFVFPRTNETQAFVRGNDNQLWILDLTTSTWDQQINRLDATLAGDPFVLGYNVLNPAAPPGADGSVISVLSTSNKNLLLEFRMLGTDVDAGQIVVGPDRILCLDNTISPAPPNHYVQLKQGSGSNSSNEAVRLVSDVSGKFAILDTALDEIPASDTRYDVFEQREAGNVTAAPANDHEVTLEAATVANQNDFVFVRGQLRQITNLAANVATIAPHWTTNPQLGDPYVLLRNTATSQRADDGSSKRVVLSLPVGPPPNITTGLTLEIDYGPGHDPVVGEIQNYISAIRGVILKEDLPDVPPVNAPYRITVGNQSEAWQAYGDPNQTELRPELSWEYFNGKGWVHLSLNDTTKNFLVPGKVIFTLPDDIAKTEVAGQENFWIRARIVGGDYGRELFSVDPVTGQVKIEKDPIRPPRILKLGIAYQLTQFQNPQVCLTLNSLNYLDQTAANLTANKYFFPFVPLTDTGKTLYFGFVQPIQGGPIKIYFAADELVVDERNKPQLRWEFAFDNDWKELLAEDGTEAFTRPDFVSLNVPDGIQNSLEFGRPLYWLRATLAKGAWSGSPLFSGVFLNTVEAIQARTVRDEILGSSIGIKNQKFEFQQTPVIEGEEVRVREALTDEEREQLISARGEDAVLTIRDQQERVLETWIRWTEVLEFFDSNSDSRDYRLDRNTGEIEFGDGIRGRIPPAGGDNIRAFVYQAGGGASGNVNPGEINTPVTAVAGVDSVINPVGAGGGSDAATNEDMLTIGPAQISHRDRAVTPDDFERLAMEASREVRKARCLPNRNASGLHELGWTTVHIVPDSKDAEPIPSLELRRSVLRYLSDRADVTVVNQEHIVIGPPEYVPITVETTVFAKSLDLVASAELQVKQQLEEFLHPLRGGPDKEGWEFGRDLAASDLYSLLEAIDDVDHVGPVRLFLGTSPSDEQVVVGPDALIASGPHRITMSVANGD